MNKENCHALLEITARYGLAEETEHVHDRVRDSKLGLMVLVTGEGNFGKSSLINALAKKQIAPVSIRPKTFKVDVYCHSGDGSEYALVRHVGEAQGTRMPIAAAEALCDQEEKAIHEAEEKNIKYRPTLTEVIWFRAGLAFGKELCLVDTPGLAQLGFGDNSIPASLVKGLGATYHVDEVWALWYHRADVVLWAFDCTKMESNDTYRTVKQLTAMYQKTIVPVATKADLVRDQRRWKEARSRFQSLYGPLLGEQAQAPLFLTVCGGKDKTLYGVGVPELRKQLLALALADQKRKLQASAAFVIDTARHVQDVLLKSADQLLKNLREIADAADVVALFAMRQTKIAVENAQKAAAVYLEEKIAGLGSGFLQLGKRLKEMKYAENSEDEMRSTACDNLKNYLKLEHLNGLLNTALEYVGKAVCDYAESVSKARKLGKVRLGASGRETRDEFWMRVHVVLPDVQLELRLPPFDLPKTDWDGLMESLGLLGKAVGWLKRRVDEIVWGSQTTDLGEKEKAQWLGFAQRLGPYLRNYPEKMLSPALQYVAEKVAQPVSSAINRCLAEVMAIQADLAELFAALQHLDHDIYQLRILAGQTKPARTNYENWARYWTSIAPDVEIVKQLVSDVVVPKLPEIQRKLGAYRLTNDEPHDLRVDPRLWEVVRTGRRQEVEPIRGMGWLWFVLALGFRPSRTVTKFPAGLALDALYYLAPGPTGAVRQPWYDVATRHFQDWVRAEPILAKIDGEAGKHVPNARFRGFAEKCAAEWHCQPPLFRFNALCS